MPREFEGRFALRFKGKFKNSQKINVDKIVQQSLFRQRLPSRVAKNRVETAKTKREQKTIARSSLETTTKK